MSDFVKGIVKLARKYRASEQDALLVRERIAIDDYIDSELALRLMYEEENKKPSSNGYAYTRFRKQLIDIDSSLKQITDNDIDDKIKSYLSKFGINQINATHEIHHMAGSETHFFENGKDRVYYDNLINKLRSNDKQLVDELKKIVIIPGWLHRYCHAKNKNYSNRRDYYKLLREILLSLDQQNDKENKIIDKQKLYSEIKCIRFNGTNVNTALNSIRNLASIRGNNNDQRLIEPLKQCYGMLRDEILDIVRNMTI